MLGISQAGRHFIYGTGRLGQDDATRPDSNTVYDLASLTKVIGLTTMVMLGVTDGMLDLDAPVVRYLPSFGDSDRTAEPSNRRIVTLRHLLTHSSGLPAWRPIYQLTSTRAEALAMIDTVSLDTVPGSRELYSDLGAIILTQVVESAFGQRIDTLLAQRVFEPLDMTSTRYLPPASWLGRIAPTENDPWRGRVLRGEVHDENASRLDGVSGHAGLFSSTRDLLRFGEWAIGQTVRRSDGQQQCSPQFPTPLTVSPSVLTDFTTRQDLPPGLSRALGWDTPSEGSSAGTMLAPGSFGHTGFTGTSIWIDPSRCLVIVLLSNRVHPTREHNRWGPVRGQVADLVVQAVDTWQRVDTPPTQP